MTELSDLLKVAGAVSASVAVVTGFATYWNNRLQRRHQQDKIAFDLHAAWWSEDMVKKRQLVSNALDEWNKAGDLTEAMKYYSGNNQNYKFTDEHNAHNRLLYFFSDVHKFTQRGLIDPTLSFEIFGEAHYSWFRAYFAAIIDESARSQSGNLPRYCKELRDYNDWLDSQRQQIAL